MLCFKSTFSAFNRPFSTEARLEGEMHVRALLGTTKIEDEADLWWAADFIAFKRLIGARADLGRWICGTSLRTGNFSLGDPVYDMVIWGSPPFEEVLSLSDEELANEFLFDVESLASRIRSEDTLVLGLFGYGNQDNNGDCMFLVGDKTTWSTVSKRALEQAVAGSKGNIVVFTTCRPGGWESDSWTLVSTGLHSKVSDSDVESACGKPRGGTSANALPDQHIDESEVRASCQASSSDDGTLCDHDLGSKRTSNHAPHRSSTDRVNGYLVFYAEPGGPAIRVVPTSVIAAIRKLRYAPPSVAFGGTLIPIAPPLSSKDEEDLRRYTPYLMASMLSTPANKAPVICLCKPVISGHEPSPEIDDKRKAELLKMFRERVEIRKQALGVALGLGGQTVVDFIGKSKGRNIRKGGA